MTTTLRPVNVSVIVGRVSLGICSVIGLVGGATQVVKAIIYFSADRYAAELTDYINLLFGAVAAFAIFVVGAFRAPFVVRLIVAIGGAVAMFVGSFIVAMIGATVAHRGGPRGNLEDGINGGIWFVLTAVFLVAIATRRWPVQQKDAPSPMAD